MPCRDVSEIRTQNSSTSLVLKLQNICVKLRIQLKRQINRRYICRTQCKISQDIKQHQSTMCRNSCKCTVKQCVGYMSSVFISWMAAGKKLWRWCEVWVVMHLYLLCLGCDVLVPPLSGLWCACTSDLSALLFALAVDRLLLRLLYQRGVGEWVILHCAFG